jgi:hypothetical protein
VHEPLDDVETRQPLARLLRARIRRDSGGAHPGRVDHFSATPLIQASTG